MSHTFSKTWKSKTLLEQEERIRRSELRNRICRNSPFFTLDTNREEMRLRMEISRRSYINNKDKHALEQEIIRKQQDAPREKPLNRLAFGGKTFDDERGNVLCFETIWCPQWKPKMEQDTKWPNLAEMKFDGDERVQTSLEHGRFLPAPRLDANDTVSWQLAPFKTMHPFDQVRRVPTTEEAMFAGHIIPELQIDDEEGLDAVGKDIMDAIDPKGIWSEY